MSRTIEERPDGLFIIEDGQEVARVKQGPHAQREARLVCYAKQLVAEVEAFLWSDDPHTTAGMTKVLNKINGHVDIKA